MLFFHALQDIRKYGAEFVSLDIADIPVKIENKWEYKENLPIRKIVEKLLKIEFKPDDFNPRFLRIDVK
jgi:hypothetical protein